MSIPVKCQCGKISNVPATMAGKRITCVGCNEALLIPKAPQSDSAIAVAVQCACGKRFKVKDDQCGKKLRCPQCNASISVSSAGAPSEEIIRESAARSVIAPEVISSKKSAPLTAFKVFAGVSAVIATSMIGWTIWYVATRDHWESENADNISAKLEEAGRLEATNPVQAYKTYDELLTEAQRHSVKGEQLSAKLVDAAKSRASLYEKVQDQIKAEQAENDRRVAAEKELAAEEAARKRAEVDAKKLADDKRRADEKRRTEAVSVYRSVPQSARTALNALKKVEARTEIGINYRDYSTVIGEAWAEVKIFVESPDGKKLIEFSGLLSKAAADYKLAHDIWHDKIEYSRLYGSRNDVDALQQMCWRQAGQYIELSDSLLDPEKTAKALEVIGRLPENEKDLAAAWRLITNEILNK